MACLILKLSILSFLTALIGSKGRDVFLEGGGGGAWGLRGEGESECQKRGGSYLFVRYPGGGIHTFPRIFLMRIFVRLLSIFLTD